MKSKGFTLIELLIVIAIIGILAAVLIPQLLGARESATERAIQAHTANVYTALVAELADTSAATVGSIAAAAPDCTVAATLPSGRYGWQTPPPAIAGCTVAANANGDDFVVTGTAPSGLVFINGSQQP